MDMFEAPQEQVTTTSEVHIASDFSRDSTEQSDEGETPDADSVRGGAVQIQGTVLQPGQCVLKLDDSIRTWFYPGANYGLQLSVQQVRVPEALYLGSY
jgi:hypothetical protein